MNKQILIVEDEIIIANSIKLHLESSGLQAEIATTPEEASILLADKTFDLVLSDINLRHEIDGITLVQEFVPKHVPIIFLTAYSDTETLRKAELSMPYAYLLKPFHKDQLLLTINLSIARAHKRSILSSLATKRTTEDIVLSIREIEIVQCVAQGKTTAEIADELFISPQTVATHRKNILQKCGCRNVIELIALAIEKDWL
ncbi:response regulator transcription factor [Sphingobacterium wenxiniae]|uniref:DNA-binding response regulator, NarL/FixJ family, contains REC and HTH domains n=1 Tax=Sphingobacterium wenxiniae TaxID=683125 RepID=A0A1I6R1E9_9SPHI|nr:DNA-binding response regulator [Sphingobacterium wenxiniae]SFS58492.1 DNA-binding response regulator, NarL/FixJ family, contains REC and HTH domains [Sphingobacterium wenxiniae]